MSPRFTPAVHLLPMLALLAGVSGCPGHLDQIGWADPDGGLSPSIRNQDNEPKNTGGNTGGSGGSGGTSATGSTGGTTGTGTTGGTGGTTSTPAPTPPTPPVKADGGASPDATAPKPPTPPAPADGGAAPDSGPAAPLPTPVCATATEIADKILTPKCGTCHGKNAPAAGLDLVTTGIKARLLNIAARGCAGKPLVTATDQVGGHFFDKLYGGVASCGGQMPFGAPPLSAVEIKCLKDWFKPTP